MEKKMVLSTYEGQKELLEIGEMIISAFIGLIGLGPLVEIY